MASIRETFPRHSKGAVNRAGAAVRRDSATNEDIEIIENWRASHNYILNTFQANLRARIKKFDEGVGFGQRLKRRTTIFDKLKRHHNMQLTTMQDIAGCRLIFSSETALLRFRDDFVRSRFRHIRKTRELAGGVRYTPYDYIRAPRASGYRGIHEVYTYVAKSQGGHPWNGLLIEIQFRTEVQHAWATSVEVCDSLTKNRGKFDQASLQYRRFFQICSEMLARKYEGRNSSLPQISDNELIHEFFNLEAELGLYRLLSNIRRSSGQFKHGRHVILISRYWDDDIAVETFDKFSSAISRYFELERGAPEDLDIVLVRGDASESIKYAFKNYFKDVTDFVRLLEACFE